MSETKLFITGIFIIFICFFAGLYQKRKNDKELAKLNGLREMKKAALLKYAEVHSIPLNRRNIKDPTCFDYLSEEYLRNLKSVASNYCKEMVKIKINNVNYVEYRFYDKSIMRVSEDGQIIKIFNENIL